MKRPGVTLSSMAQQESQTHQTDVRTLARGVGIGFLGRAVGRVLNLVSQVAVARWLGPAAFGLYSTAWNLMNLSGQIVPLGLPSGAIRFAPRYRPADPAGFKTLLFRCLGLAGLSGVIAGGAVFVSAESLADLLQKPDLAELLRYVAWAFPLGAIMLTLSAATRISQRIGFSVGIEDITQPTVDLLLILLFYLVGGHLLGFMAAGVLSYLAAVIYGLYGLNHLFPDVFDRRIKLTHYPGYGELLRFSLPTAAATMFAVLVIRVDRLIVAYLLPSAEVGVYQAASQFSIIFATIISAISAIFTPMVSDLFHRGQTERLQELFRVTTKWMLYLSIPPFLVTAFAPRDVMVALFGAEYAAGATPLLILSLARLAHAASGAGNDLLVMAGKQNQWFAVSSSMLIVNVSLIFLLGPRWGLNGVALATLCAMSGMFLLLSLLTRRHVGVWPYDRRYLKGLAAAAVAALAVVLLSRLGIASPLARITLLALAATGLFAGSLWALGLDAEDRAFLGLLRARLARR